MFLQLVGPHEAPCLQDPLAFDPLDFLLLWFAILSLAPILSSLRPICKGKHYQEPKPYTTQLHGLEGTHNISPHEGSDT